MKIITPTQAAAQVKQDNVIFVDVRSQQEFAQGHPAGAVNIPLLDHGPSGQMEPNPEFVPVFQATFPEKSAPIVLTCRSGGRSGRAGEILERLGYTDVTNMDGGYGGNAGVTGWADSNLPINNETGEGVSYASLKGKARL